MGVDAVIRVATSRDIDTLESLRRAATEEQDGAVADPGFSGRFREWYRQEEDRRVFWIAEVDATMVGMANLVVFRRMPRPGRDAGGWGYLGNAYVMASHRNRGIGRLLLAAIVDYADAEGLERIVLNPSERSVPLYQGAGFRPAAKLLIRDMIVGYR
jgi:GNAT superfamily N-acetyltransferase